MKVHLRKDISKKTGNASLYLEFWLGGKRSKEYLGLTIYNDPKTAIEKQHNKAQMQIAEKLLNKRIYAVQNETYGVQTVTKRVLLSDFISDYVTTYNKSNKRMYKAMFKHFTDFISDRKYTNLRASGLSPLICEQFGEYLKSLPNLHYSTPSDYFKKFKVVIRQANKERVCTVNIDEVKVKFSFDSDAIRKPILTKEEISEMLKIKSHNAPNIAAAFIFSLNTGFDYKTVSTLTWANLDANYIVFDRSKTKRQNRIMLNDNALASLPKKSKNKNDLIFNLPTWTACVKYVRGWAKRAGIDKKITWHSARHSLGSMLVNDLDINIRVVQDIFGHSDLKTTMRYTKVRNQAKANAINSLPDMKLK